MPSLTMQESSQSCNHPINRAFLSLLHWSNRFALRSNRLHPCILHQILKFSLEQSICTKEQSIALIDFAPDFDFLHRSNRLLPGCNRLHSGEFDKNEHFSSLKAFGSNFHLWKYSRSPKNNYTTSS